MPRLIDADALRELIDGGYDVDFEELPETKQALLEMIDYQDTVDAVEVVRCRECKHYQYTGSRAFGWAVKCCVITGFEDVDDEDFCSRGERKE